MTEKRWANDVVDLVQSGLVTKSLCDIVSARFQRARIEAIRGAVGRGIAEGDAPLDVTQTGRAGKRLIFNGESIGRKA